MLSGSAATANLERHCRRVIGSPVAKRALSYRPPQLRAMERLQIVNRIRRVVIHIPFEEPQRDSIRQKIGNGEAVLLDRLDLLFHVKIRRRSRTHAASSG